MNKVLLLFLVIALFACKNKEKSTSTETEKPIKTATDVVENSQPTARKVDFSVRVIRPYCGGAAPSEEMEQMRMKGEMANKFVFYIENNNGVSKRVITNEVGVVSIELEPGEYCVKEGYKADPEMKKELEDSNWEFDKECISEWNATCNHEFSVTNDKNALVSFIYKPKCGWEGPVPCITNAGFPPP